jgi:hypothetical protein
MSGTVKKMSEMSVIICRLRHDSSPTCQRDPGEFLMVLKSWFYFLPQYSFLADFDTAV